MSFDVVKLGRVARTISGVGFPHDFQGQSEGEIPFIKVSDLADGHNLNGIVTARNWISREALKQLGARVAPANSIVFPKVGAALLKNTRRILRRVVAMDNNLMAVFPAVGDPRYWNYALQLVDLGELSGGGPLPYVSDGQVRDLRIPFPPVEEQRRIADFLDAEVIRIDQMVQLQQTVKKILEERDQAVLDQEIDRLIGLYGVRPLRHAILRVEQGYSPLCDNTPAVEGEWGVLKVSAVKSGRFVAEENKRLPATIKPDSRYEVRAGDLLITRANTPALVGAAAVVQQAPRRLLLCDKIFRIELDYSLNKDFVAAVARGTRIRDLCMSASHGTSQSMANLKVQEIKEWPIPIVDLQIQHAVVARIEQAHRHILQLRRDIDRQIALLEERRQALITAAVTGQIDVPTVSRIAAVQN